MFLNISKKNNEYFVNKISSVYHNYYTNAIKYITKDIDSFKCTISLTDELQNSENESEILVMSSNDGRKFKLCSLWGLLLFKKIGTILEYDIPWSSKKPIAIWRGSTTGSLDLSQILGINYVPLKILI